MCSSVLSRGKGLVAWGLFFASVTVTLKTIVNGINGYLNTLGSFSTRISFFLSHSRSLSKKGSRVALFKR